MHSTGRSISLTCIGLRKAGCRHKDENLNTPCQSILYGDDLQASHVLHK